MLKHPHGTRQRYQNRCSCTRCREANREYQRVWRNTNTPADVIA